MGPRSYVEAVIDAYVWVPGTPSRASRNDRRLARSLEQRGIVLDAALSAVFLGAARRVFRSRDAEPLAPIRTLYYFLPVLEEILDHPIEPGYSEYLKAKLAPLAKSPIPPSIPARLDAIRIARPNSRASS
jgi:hypothetical protein